MSQGTLQQMGTPDQIYEHPANRFVAEFVGNPPINILTLAGTAASDLAVAMGQYLDANFSALNGASSVGIRPEAVRWAPDSAEIPATAFTAPVTVTGILPTGGTWIIELHSAGDKLFLTTDEPPEIGIGQQVQLWVKPKALHLFDAAGKRVEGADALLRSKKS
jgi:iron(III) transport system ATP-binding protein